MIHHIYRKHIFMYIITHTHRHTQTWYTATSLSVHFFFTWSIFYGVTFVRNILYSHGLEMSIFFVEKKEKFLYTTHKIIHTIQVQYAWHVRINFLPYYVFTKRNMQFHFIPHFSNFFMCRSVYKQAKNILLNNKRETYICYWYAK